MSLTFTLFSSVPVKDAKKIVDKYMNFCNMLEEAYPFYWENQEYPPSNLIDVSSFKKWEENVNEKLAQQVCNLSGGAAPKSVLEVDGVPLEFSPLMVSVLNFFMDELKEGVFSWGEGETLETFTQAKKELKKFKSEGDLESFIMKHVDDKGESTRDSTNKNMATLILDFLDYLQDFERDQHKAYEVRELVQHLGSKDRSYMEYIMHQGPDEQETIAKALKLPLKEVDDSAQRILRELKEIFEE